MKIGLLQHNPISGYCQGNSEKLIGMAEEAAALGADLCIAPELALCGPNAGDLFFRQDFVASCRSCMEAMARILQEKGLPPLLLGGPVPNPVPGGKPLHNCAVLLAQGNLSVVGRKVILPSDHAMNDVCYFEPGISPGVMQIKGWRLAVTIGEDIWNNTPMENGESPPGPDPVAEVMDASGGDILINLAALPYTMGVQTRCQRLVQWLARRHHVPVLTVNCAGGCDSLIFHGGSMACDSKGNLLAEAPLFEESVTVVDLASKTRQEPVPLSKEEKLWKALVLGTRDFVHKSGFTGAILGLSGGVDSALVAAIAVAALGSNNVTAVNMPSLYSSPGSVDDSVTLAANLGLRLQNVPIAPALDGYRAMFDASFGKLCGLTEENIQARIRGAILMAFANEYSVMVLNTGNKSEAACGYCTLYGDQVGALGVISDLYKHQVYSLCRWYNETHGPIIPEAILTKEPSAELRPGQKDSDSLPPYPELDAILALILEERKGVDALVADGHDRHTVTRVLGMVHRARFKRQQAPTGLRISDSCLNVVWNTPIAGKVVFE